MNKVVAFLEKYAEWVALSLGAIFLLYMVYDNVVVPEAIRTKVGSEAVLPGEVDPTLNRNVITRLQQNIEAPAGNLQGAFDVKDATAEFYAAMGPKRARMEPEFLAGGVIRPPLPGTSGVIETPGTTEKPFATLPTVPTPVHAGMATGNSLVALPQPLPAPGEEQPVQPAVEDPAVVLANAIDKHWIMVEWKFPLKDLTASWKTWTKNAAGVPPEALMTAFMNVVVEREEQVGPGQWGNAVTLKPLPLVWREEWPKDGDPEGQEKYRAWAEKNQVTIVEPPFFRILRGDPWYIPSIGQPKDPSAAAAEAVGDQPFDPANPNIPFEKMTPFQKQQVYLYKKKIRDEEERQKAMERKSKMDSARSTRGAASGGERGGSRGGRSIGGYAPLPPAGAGAGRGLSDYDTAGHRGGAGPALPPGLAGRGGDGASGKPRGAQPPNRGYEPPDRTPRAGERGYEPPDRRRPEGGRENPAVAPTGPMVDQAGMVQNSLLTGPFDPTKLPVDAKGQIPDLQVWAYDETAMPGKTYRYRMKLKLKNPIFHTYGLTEKGKEALSDQFVIESEWSAWKEVVAPRSTEFFFATSRRPIGGKTVTQVVADVFKHERGEWTRQQFVLAPGDAIGGPKENVDYSTGNTIVDLRLDTREKDVQILIADEAGNVSSRSLEADASNDWYKALQEKVRPGAVAPGGQASGVNPALINEVGTR